MTQKHTITAALALVGIAGHEKGLTWRTRMNLTRLEINLNRDLVAWQCEDMSKPFYSLTEAGLELAKTSRLWKAHERLLELGFRPDASRLRRARVGHISYTDDEGRTAFTGRHGRAYAAIGESKWRCLIVGEYRNG